MRTSSGCSSWRRGRTQRTLYTEQERAALALTEALTRLPDARDVPDAVYDRAAAAFTPEQLAAVAWVATTINAFNRLGVLGRKSPPKR